ncbi:3-deoxy-manno-octulosonate cytidylyltransferase [Aureimonas pseudogalii]|uniref:3-deoxy-manno-octulosonate cytidylyltransferase n=1 Tax=Aureimonas pseudogalii TaxID=1744844 RepID=A0A7W6H8Y1_9HYPH|nr:3-deoxy-manno-octulosonate cytidylyltransferase [Aureimonas pseudogalii]MBB4000786.1 hypothetical protein [Aureimonas pseudogalii]
MAPALPQAGETDAAKRWAAIFAGYETIVLVANSDAVRVRDLARRYGAGTLFVFFNKVYKVLSEPFDRPSLLTARSSAAGANIVYRRETADVVRLLRSPNFLGICNLRVGSRERFSPAADFAIPEPVGHLDLTATLNGFYPSSHVATSGFALALFLAESLPGHRIVLAGFTARRSTRWKLFADHDWTFEQIVQRLLLRAGRLQSANATAEDWLTPITRRFPEIDPVSIGAAAAEVVAERLEGANLAIDDLLRVTRPQRRLNGWLKALKPKTRKARLAERDAQPPSSAS